MRRKLKQLFCKHENKKIFFVGFRKKKNKMVKTIFSECESCGKVIKYDKPNEDFGNVDQKKISTYYYGMNPND